MSDKNKKKPSYNNHSINKIDSLLELKKAQQTQSVLYSIANLNNKDLELKDFYEELHTIIGTIIYSENFYIALKEQEHDAIRMAYYVDTKDDTTVDSFSLLPMDTIKKTVTYYAINTGKPLLLTRQSMADLTKEQGFKVVGTITNSWLGIPLILDGHVIGLMTLQSYIKDKFLTEDDKELMIFVAQHVAVALERHKNKNNLQELVKERTKALNQTNKKLQKQIDETNKSRQLQNALYKITDLSSTAKDMNFLYYSLHEIISQLMYAENLYICLYSKNKTQLDFVYYVDTFDLSNQKKIKNISMKKLTKTYTGQVLMTGSPLLKTPKNKKSDEKKALRIIGENSCYWLGVPLKIDDDIIGALVVQSYSEEHEIDVIDKELLEFVSQHIALTLERKQDQSELEGKIKERTNEIAEANKSLQQQVVERKRSEGIQSLLYKIASISSMDIPQKEVFESVHFSLINYMACEFFYIAVWNEERNDMDWLYFVDPEETYQENYLEMTENMESKTLAQYVFTHEIPLSIDENKYYEMVEMGDVTLNAAPAGYYLGVPLKSNGKIIGVMAAQSNKATSPYSQVDLELLKFVSHSVVSTIERIQSQKKLESKVEQRTQELTVSNQRLQTEILQRKGSEELQTALFKISQTSQQSDNEQEIYLKLHEIISQLMYAECFYIVLVDKENNRLNYDYAVDNIDKDIPVSMPIGNSLTSYVYNQKRTIHLSREGIVELFKKENIVTIGALAVDWVGVPLQSRGEIYGIMVLQTYEENEKYSIQEIEILNFVSTHIAEALERNQAKKKLKNANLELIEKSKIAEAASEAKSSFLATVSHEIRTPMNGVLGMLSLMGDTSLNNQQKDYISKISYSANSLLDIINDILDFSKIEEGKLKLGNIEFNLLEVINNLNDIFSETIKEKNLEYSVNIKTEINKLKIGDPMRLSQILINLIGNSIKFTQQGFIKLTVTQKKENRVLFSVEDSGIGIPIDKRKTIFSSFTQADDTTTRKYGGSGLGLSICQELVAMMNGWIKITGDYGEGSCFSFEVNIDESENDIPTKLIKKIASLKKERIREKMKGVNILLAEDNLINQQIAKEILKQSGAIVTVVDNGKNAVDACKSKKFDLILMDMQMPIMDGYEASDIIRQKYLLEELPIIAMTANVMKDDREKCLRHGMNDYISKPIKREILFNTIEQYLN